MQIIFTVDVYLKTASMFMLRRTRKRSQWEAVLKMDLNITVFIIIVILNVDDIYV